MKMNNILEAIGNTPHINISSLYNNKITVWLKLEKQNPGGSIKDRVALSMIEDAEKRGILKKDSTIIEATSGNTGIGLALISAVKKYALILVMPNSMSIERQKILKTYGAKIELTPSEMGMQGAIDKSLELAKNIKESWIPSQFTNKSNVNIHYSQTAEEIIEDFPRGIDHLIGGVGTGGHISGCAKKLKQKFHNLKVFAVEPKLSAVISGEKSGSHSIQGIGAGFVPQNLEVNLLDDVIKISKDEAFTFTRRAAKELGLFMGISSGANLAAIAKRLPQLKEGSQVVTFCYDTGERYLSVDDLF